MNSMTGVLDMAEDELLAKLEQKYERPKPGPCRVCGADVVIAHKGGGLPLKWVCGTAKQSLDKGDTEALSHVAESAWLDYRPVGDARVMKLLAMYRELRRRLPVGEAQGCLAGNLAEPAAATA